MFKQIKLKIRDFIKQCFYEVLFERQEWDALVKRTREGEDLALAQRLTNAGHIGSPERLASNEVYTRKGTKKRFVNIRKIWKGVFNGR